MRNARTKKRGAGGFFLALRAFAFASFKIGGYLLSRLADSTIGAIGLNCSVRNGKRWNPDAITT